jgi:Fe-S cluster assembly scaffold protein SufB
MKEPILFKNQQALFEAGAARVSNEEFVAPANAKKSWVKYWNEISAEARSPSANKVNGGLLAPATVEPQMRSFHLHAQENSRLEYVLFQNLPLDIEAMATIKISAEKNAQVQLTVIQNGAARANVEVRAECLGAGADIQIRGLQNAKGAQKFAINVHAVHSVPNTRSDLVVYCVARDTSQSIFNGLVTIEKNAHHTEAYQKNKNLLLSEKATIDTFPKLFIANDEVKCAHGSSTSTLEPEQFIYLQSRGINQVDAENMLTSGFLNQALDWISDAPEKIKLAKALEVYEEGAWDE